MWIGVMPQARRRSGRVFPSRVPACGHSWVGFVAPSADEHAALRAADDIRLHEICVHRGTGVR
jgi:hypothetical protein